MKTIIEYSVLSSAMVERVSKLVNEQLAEGWQPYGNMFTSLSGNKYIQPMVKYKEDRKIVVDESKVIVKNPIMIKENKEK